jgi:hypothetical protein
MCNTTSILDDASPPTDVPVVLAMNEMTESAPTDGVGVIEEEEEYLEGVGKLIRDLAHSDNAKVNTALAALLLELKTGEEKRNTVIAWGGCAALVHLLKDRLRKVIKKIPACGQVTELHELPDLETIKITLRVIIQLTYHSEMRRSGMVAVGGVEAVVKAMKTFPKCQTLQAWACGALRNLACYSIGKKKALESGGIEVLLATVTNHLDSAKICEHACWALYNIVKDSKENTELLISLGGGAAVAKVRTKSPDKTGVQTPVRHLASLIVAEMKAWPKPVVRQENKAAAAAASDRRDLVIVALGLAMVAILICEKAAAAAASDRRDLAIVALGLAMVAILICEG